MKKSMIFCTFISTTLLSGCGIFHTHTTFTKIKQVKPFKVQLKVVGGELTNDKPRNANCTGFADNLKKGCFVAEKDDVLELEFKLTRRAEGKKWRFTKVMICAGTTKPVPMNTCSLNAAQRAEWLINVKNQIALMPASGTVELKPYSERLRLFSVLDINGQAGEYTYNIQACPEGNYVEADCAWMDPGGMNKGR